MHGGSLAAEFINFGDKPDALLSKRLAKWLEDQGMEGSEYGLARIHLNSDKVPETIIRFYNNNGGCLPLSGCRHFALAEVDGKLVAIGEFNALSVGRQESPQSGISDLMVCNNPWNDFDCRIYRWDAEAGSYQENIGLAK